MNPKRIVIVGFSAIQTLMKRTPVVSSSIVSVGYDSQSQVLELEFEGGNVYQYFEVPQSVHERLLDADSIGGFVNKEIKGVYGFREIYGS